MTTRVRALLPLLLLASLLAPRASLPAENQPVRPRVLVEVLPNPALVMERITLRVTVIAGNAEFTVPKVDDKEGNDAIPLELIDPNGRVEEPLFHVDFFPGHELLWTPLKPGQIISYVIPLSKRRVRFPTKPGTYKIVAFVPHGGSLPPASQALVGREEFQVRELKRSMIRKSVEIPMRFEWRQDGRTTALIESVSIDGRLFLFYRESVEHPFNSPVRLCQLPDRPEFIASGSAAGIHIAYVTAASKVRFLSILPAAGAAVVADALLPDELMKLNRVAPGTAPLPR